MSRTSSESNRRNVFLSYKRDAHPDAQLVHEVHGELRTEHDVFLDVDMLPGQKWAARIEEEIGRADFLVAFLSRQSIRSEMVIAEIEIAHRLETENGRPVILPVRLGFEAPFPYPLSAYLNRFQDFRWKTSGDTARMLNTLRTAMTRVSSFAGASSSTTASVAGDIVNVPEVPPFYLPRTGLTQTLTDMLRPGGKAGIAGMGGAGKTVLAAAAVRDEEVRRRFRDGIVWITLGQQPVLTLRQAQLARSLDDRAWEFLDVQDGRARLSQLTAGKACLLVLDDVWNPQHIGAFNVLGRECGVLITTRDTRVLRAAGAAVLPLSLFESDEAREFLAGCTGIGAKELPPLADEILRLCGYLPLAIAMIGGMLREGRWENVADKLQRSNFEAIRREFADYPYESLLDALQVSVEELTEPALQRFLDMAIFREDARIPERSVLMLWGAAGMSVFDAQDLIDELVNRSLVQRDGSRRLFLHDLHFHYLRRRRTGETLQQLHGAFLESCRALCSDGWPSAPDDGYLRQNLTYHMRMAGRTGDLADLLSDFAWLETRLESARHVAELVSDFDDAAGILDLKLVQSAVRLGAHALARDKTELATQVYGRLVSHRTPLLDRLVGAIRSRQAPWLRPLGQPLAQAGGAELFTLFGHAAAVVTVDVAHDGRQALSGDYYGVLKLWDLVTGAEVRSWRGHESATIAAAFSHDGRRAISASHDGTLRVWEAATGTAVTELKGHTAWVRAVVWSRDDRTAVSAAHDGTIRLWNASTGTETAVIATQDRYLNAVALTHDGGRAVAGGRSLTVWDVGSKSPVLTFGGHDDGVMALVLTPDGKQVISGGRDKAIKLWNLETGALIRTLSGHADMVTSLFVFRDGTRLLSGSGDRTLKLWDLMTGAALRTFTGHFGPVWAVAASAAGDRLLSASSDSTVKVWDPQGAAGAGRQMGHIAPVRGVALTSDGQRALSTAGDSSVAAWNAPAGEEIASARLYRIMFSDDEGMYCFQPALTGDGRFAAFVSIHELRDLGKTRREIQLADLQDGLAFHPLETIGDSSQDAIWHFAAFAAGGEEVIAFSGWANAFKVWDRRTGQAIRTFPEIPARIGSATVALGLMSDGRTMALAQSTGGLLLWDLEGGAAIRSVAEGETFLNIATLSSPGRAVTVSEAGNVHVWDLESGSALRKMFLGEVAGPLATTGDGRFAVVAMSAFRVQVLDLEREIRVAAVTLDSAPAACAISSDGRTIAVGEVSGRLQFFSVDGER